MQSSPTSRHLLPLRSKYSPQHPVLKHPQSIIQLVQFECMLCFKFWKNLNDSSHHNTLWLYFRGGAFSLFPLTLIFSFAQCLFYTYHFHTKGVEDSNDRNWMGFQWIHCQRDSTCLRSFILSASGA
jgi:hypothetical protein